MQIPGTRPFGLPKDVTYTSKNVRIWMGKGTPGMFKTYSPISAAGDALCLGSFLAYLGAAATGKDDLKKWSGRISIASIFPSLLCGLHNGTLRAVWDQIKGSPLKGNYLADSNDKKGEFLSSIETIYHKDRWRDNIDSSKLQETYDNDKTNKKILLEMLSLNNVKAVSEEIERLNQLAFGEDSNSKDPGIKAARAEYHYKQHGMESYIATAGMLDDIDLIPALAAIAEADNTRFSFEARKALVKSENTFNDSRALPTLIKLLKNGRSEIANSLHSETFIKFIEKTFSDPNLEQINDDLAVSLVGGILKNENLLGLDEMQRIVLDIADGTIQNKRAKSELIFELSYGHPKSNGLFEELVNILSGTEDFKKVDLDKMYERHSELLSRTW